MNVEMIGIDDIVMIGMTDIAREATGTDMTEIENTETEVIEVTGVIGIEGGMIERGTREKDMIGITEVVEGVGKMKGFQLNL